MILKIIILTILLPIFSNAEDLDNENLQWMIEDNIYYTNGLGVNRFGFRVENDKVCDIEFMYLLVNTINKEIININDGVVTLNFTIDDEIKFSIDASFSAVWIEAYKIAFVQFNMFMFNKPTMDLLENSKTLQIMIDQNHKMAKYFDIPGDEFSLIHMADTRKMIVKKQCDFKF